MTRFLLDGDQNEAPPSLVYSTLQPMKPSLCNLLSDLVRQYRVYRRADLRMHIILAFSALRIMQRFSYYSGWKGVSLGHINSRSAHALKSAEHPHADGDYSQDRRR